MKSKIQIEELV